MMIGSKFKNKNILFISPRFFNYELEIKKELEKKGAIVDYFDDRPSNSTFMKVCIRLKIPFTNVLVKKYYKNLIKITKEKKYDFIFFIKCESISLAELSELKKIHQESIFILYLWDSIRNIKGIDRKLVFFDKAFSFDLNDCNSIKSLDFRPLFYLDIYCSNKNKYKSLEYDVSFIGTDHSDRAYVINTLRKELDKRGNSYYFKLYPKSKLIYYLSLIAKKDFRELANQNIITLEKISPLKIKEIMEKSNCILDIEHLGQDGLTMRTIEILGMRKKIATTNYHIQSYDFFSLNNICIIDRSNPNIDKEFLKHKYIDIDTSIYDKYSINSWIDDIFYVGGD